ncbi:M24 family metallopeptidase [Rheinheimera sp.]|uniref:M24 family metallopeptidase n=1 Tax=Rheinheimera sp. TaxID=1869214 RepID=UPI0027B92F15|nr:M24 family metallopeptidase [Rheinheimera sp.]
MTTEISTTTSFSGKTISGKEQVGAGFSLQLMQQAQQKAWQALKAIQHALKPGITEVEAVLLAKDILTAHGADRLWHPVIIRFGANTTKTYDQPSDRSIRLAQDDIVFIDIGPVFAGHEADVGATFVLGDDEEKQRCAAAAELIFQQVRQRWLDLTISGEALYQYAEQLCCALGYQLNLAIKGHRICDFPHKLYQGGNLGDFSAVPRPGVWVLEIQLKHPNLDFGAFYEDVLLESEAALETAEPAVE